MTRDSIPDNRVPIHLRAWLNMDGDPLRDLSLIDRGFSRQATEQLQHTAQLVTPSATLRELLMRCLSALDLVVTDAGAPDLIVLDLAAPDALTHCRVLRQQHPELPIVVLTPLTTEHLSAWEAGATAVLPIPFDVLDLHATIRILLVQLCPHTPRVVPSGHEDTKP